MTTIATAKSSTHLLASETTCVTAQKRINRRTALLFLVLVLSLVAVAVSYVSFRPAALSHPDFEANAVHGTPKVDEKYVFSDLTVNDDYHIQLCGSPACDGQNVSLYLHNPAGNNVWFRAEVLDKHGNLLASTGVLKPGEYLPSVTLSKSLEPDMILPVLIRIVGYQPNTWQSAGNVNLEMTLRVK